MTDPVPRFRLDRQVSLALILAVVLQTAAALLWAGRAAARIDEMERRLETQGPVAERLARLEEQVAGVKAGVERIERRLTP